MNEDLAARIAARPAPKVTPDRIKALIVGEDYHRLTGTLTVCVLTLANGFTVTGESACASPENYDEQIGNEIARKNAVEKIWGFEGYLLRQTLTDMAPTMPLFSVITAAAICHEANRSLCYGQGDDSQPAWGDAPNWQHESAIAGVEFHLANPLAGTDDSHKSWMAQKEAEGWVYGPTKNPEAKEHPCMVPYDQLPPEQQVKDYLFRGIIHAIAPFISRD